MPNKASDNLFELIRSLSRSEKRYFKLFAARHTIGEKNNYLRLFEAIDAQAEYNEKKLREQFEGEAFLNNLSIVKARLYDTVLKSLKAFHNESSVEVRLQGMLHSIELLFARALYKQAAKLTDKAFKLAKKHECINYIPELLRWEKSLLEKEQYCSKKLRSATVIAAHEQQTLQQLSYHQLLWQHKSELLQLLHSKGKAHSSNLEETLASTLQQVANIPVPALTSADHYLFHHIYSIYYFAQGAFKECHKHLSQNKQLLQNDKLLKTREPELYLTTLSNLVYVALRSKFTDAAYSHLEQLKEYCNTLENTGDLAAKAFSCLTSARLSFAIRSGNFDLGLRVVTRLQEELDQYGTALSPVRRAFINFEAANLCFCTNDHAQALRWINNLLDQQLAANAEELQLHAQLLELLIHFEKENYTYVQSALRSTQRFIQSRDREFETEQTLLRYLKKLSFKKAGGFRQQVLSELASKLQLLKKNEAVAFEYFDYQLWVESKLRDRSMENLMKESFRSTVIAA